MRVAVLSLVLAGILLGSTATNANAKPSVVACQSSKHAVVFYREATWRWQTKRGHPKTQTSHSERWAKSCPYLRWVARLWVKRSVSAKKEYNRYLRHLQDVRANDPIAAIQHVFGKYASEAIAVARCESGGTFSVYASNGQYQGMFQMGSGERARYGHGYTAIEQARAAYRYFAASGYDWSPWQCRPYGLGW